MNLRGRKATGRLLLGVLVFFWVLFLLTGLVLFAGIEAAADGIGVGIQSDSSPSFIVDFGQVTPLRSPYIKKGALSVSVQSDLNGWNLAAEETSPLATAGGVRLSSGISLKGESGWLNPAGGRAELYSNQPATGGTWRSIPIDARLDVSWDDELGSYSGTLVFSATAGVNSALSTVQPNPFSPNGDSICDTVTVNYYLAQSRQVREEIRTAGGENVRGFPARVAAAGYQEFTWDGLTDALTSPPDGTYQYQVLEEGTGATLASGTIELDTIPPETHLATPVEEGEVDPEFEIAGDSEPLASVRVRVEPSGGEGFREYISRAGEDGLFRTSATSYPGRNRLLVFSTDLAGNAWETEMTVYNNQALSLAVPDGEWVVARQAVTIKGRGPIGTRVKAVRHDGWVTETPSDQDGCWYCLLSLLPGENRFTFGTKPTGGESPVARTLTVTYDPDGEEGVAFSGTVRDRVTGSPLPEAEVVADGARLEVKGGHFAARFADLADKAKETVTLAVRCPNYRSVTLIRPINGVPEDVFLDRNQVLSFDYQSPPAVEIGEVAWFEVRIKNVSNLDIDSIAVKPSFPAGWTVVRDCREGGEVFIGSLVPGESRTVDLPVLVGVESKPGYAPVSLSVYGACRGDEVSGGPLTKNVLIRGGIFRSGGEVFGRVWLDGDGDSLLGDGDTPLSGAAVRLPDGTYARTDAFGRFSFHGLKAGTYYLSLGEETLPEGVQASGGRFVRLLEGEVVRADFPLARQPLSRRDERQKVLNGFFAGPIGGPLPLLGKLSEDPEDCLRDDAPQAVLLHDYIWPGGYHTRLKLDLEPGEGAGQWLDEPEGFLPDGDESTVVSIGGGPVTGLFESETARLQYGRFRERISIPKAWEVDRWLDGAAGELHLPHGSIKAFAAEEKVIRVKEYLAVDSAYGPYHLSQGPVVAGTEEVYLHKVRREAGGLERVETMAITRDGYRLDLEEGLVVFVRPFLADPTGNEESWLEVSYDIPGSLGQGFAGQGTTYGAWGEYTRGALSWTGALVKEGKYWPERISAGTSLELELPSSRLTLAYGAQTGKEASLEETVGAALKLQNPVEETFSVHLHSQPAVGPSNPVLDLAVKRTSHSGRGETEVSGQASAAVDGRTKAGLSWLLRAETVPVELARWRAGVEREIGPGVQLSLAAEPDESGVAWQAGVTRELAFGPDAELAWRLGASMSDKGLAFPSYFVLRWTRERPLPAELFLECGRLGGETERLLVGGSLTGIRFLPGEVECRTEWDVHDGLQRWMGFLRLKRNPYSLRAGMERSQGGDLTFNLGGEVKCSAYEFDAEAKVLSLQGGPRLGAEVRGVYRPLNANSLLMTGALSWERKTRPILEEECTASAAVLSKPAADWALGAKVDVKREWADGISTSVERLSAHISHDLTKKLQAGLIASWWSEAPVSRWASRSALEVGYRLSEYILFVVGCRRVDRVGSSTGLELYNRLALAF